MKKIFYVLVSIFITLTNVSLSQNPNPALIGYWQNWDDFQCPYVRLTQIDTSYNIIPVAFAVPASGTSYNMTFTPDGITPLSFKQQIDTMHLRGKKVIISIGGANDPVTLNDTNQRNSFISSMMTIITTYGFDGMDIDLEGGSLVITGGTIANPTDAKTINLIYAIKKIMTNFRAQYGKKMILTMAPETAYVTGGMSAFGSIWGAYLPVIHALRDSIEVLQVQLYNSGSMYGIDGQIYFQGTVDFILSQTEAVIHGFNTAGGYFTGLRADQVAVGLPACSNAAGGGYIISDSVKAAINYLRGLSPKPAHYTCVNSYPALRGMMNWSINWDKVATCGSVYEFANNFNNIFRSSQTLSMNVFIQGFYIPGADTTRRDTIKVLLRDTISPYVIRDSSKAFLNPNGSASIKFTNAQNNKRYYLIVKHRNSIETWSKGGGEIFTSSALSYNFTSSSSQAFGNNLIQIDSSPLRFAIFSGDVDQSGSVDVSDLVAIYNNALILATGYLATDVNGDNFTDVTDLLIAYNNSINLVSVKKP